MKAKSKERHFRGMKDTETTMSVKDIADLSHNANSILLCPIAEENFH